MKELAKKLFICLPKILSLDIQTGCFISAQIPHLLSLMIVIIKSESPFRLSGPQRGCQPRMRILENPQRTEPQRGNGEGAGRSRDIVRVIMWELGGGQTLSHPTVLSPLRTVLHAHTRRKYSMAGKEGKVIPILSVVVGGPTRTCYFRVVLLYSILHLATSFTHLFHTSCAA